MLVMKNSFPSRMRPHRPKSQAITVSQEPCTRALRPKLVFACLLLISQFATAEVITGTEANDLLRGSGKNDIVDGLGGNDTYVMNMLRAEVEIITLEGITRVHSRQTVRRFSKISLRNVETITFRDQSVSLESSDGNKLVVDQELVLGTAADDVIDSWAYFSSTVKGSDGIDTLVVFAQSDLFKVATIEGVTQLHTIATDKDDYLRASLLVLVDIERVVFIDKTINLLTRNIDLSLDSTGDASSEHFLATNVIYNSDPIIGAGGNDSLIIFSNAENYTITTIEGVSRLYTEQPGLPNRVITHGVERVVFENGVTALAVNDSNFVGQGTIDGKTNSRSDSDKGEVFHIPWSSQASLSGFGGADSLIIFDQSKYFSLIAVGGVYKLYSLAGAERNYDSFELGLRSIERLVFQDQVINLRSTPEVVVELNRFAFESLERGETLATDGDDVFEIVDYRSSYPILVVDGGDGRDTLIMYNELYSVETVRGLTRLESLYGVRWLLNIEQLSTRDADISLETSNIDVLIPTLSRTGTSGDDNILLQNPSGHPILNGGTGIDSILIFGKSTEFELFSAGGLTRLHGNTPGGEYSGNEYILANIEELVFLDKSVPLNETFVENPVKDTSPNGEETILGTSDDETFWLRGDRDIVFGGAGYDKAVLFIDRDQAEIITAGAYTKVSYGTDFAILNGIEEIAFRGSSLPLPAFSTLATDVILAGFSGPTLGTNGADIFDLTYRGNWFDGREGQDTGLVFFDASNIRYDTLGGVTRLLIPYAESLTRTVLIHSVETLSFRNSEVKLATSDKPLIHITSVDFTGTESSEIFVAQDGALDGGGGDDEVVLFENSSDYTVTSLSGVTLVQEKDAGIYDFYQYLTNVESFHFLDRSLTLPTSPVSLITGTFRNDNLRGSDADETFAGHGGRDLISGGGGKDTVLVFDLSTNYDVTTVLGQTKVTRKIQPFHEWELTLEEIEEIHFMDHVVALDTESNGEIILVNGSSNSKSASDGDDFLSLQTIEPRRSYTVNGAGGYDTFIIFDQLANYSISTVGGITRLTHNTNYHQITLVNIEVVQFDDNRLVLPETGNLQFRLVSDSGSEQDETFELSSGGDFNGGDGSDSLVVFGKRSDYLVVTHQDTTLLSKFATSERTYTTHTIENIETIYFEDAEIAIPPGSIKLSRNRPSNGVFEGTSGADHWGGVRLPSLFKGADGEDVFYIFEAASHFAVKTIEGVTRIYNRSFEAFEGYQHQNTTLLQTEEVRFSDITVTLETGDKIPVKSIIGTPTMGTPGDDLFASFTTWGLDGGPGLDTLIVFDSSSKFQWPSGEGITTLSVRTSQRDQVEREYLGSVTLKNIEKIQFLDELVYLDTFSRNPDSNAKAYLVTNSLSQNHTEVHVINSGTQPQHFMASLYSGTGEPVGQFEVKLTESPLPPQARLVLTATDLENMFEVKPWKGPATLDIRGESHFDVMTKLRSPSGLVSNTNCVRQKNANNVEGADSDIVSYLRLINDGFENIRNIRATLYNASGDEIGESNQLLIEELRANEAFFLSRPQLEDIFGTSWSGTASLSIENPHRNLRLLDLSLVENTFFNFSCYQADNDAAAYLQTSSDSVNRSFTHIVNTSDSDANFTGSLYSGAGTFLGQTEVPLNDEPVKRGGRLVLDSTELESKLGAESWRGPAILKIESPASFDVMTKLTSPGGLVSNSNCVRKYNVHNIEGFDEDVRTFVRIINVGGKALQNITGTVYDTQGNVVGSADTVLIENMAPNEAVWINRDELSEKIGATWEQEASLVLTSKEVEQLRLLNLNLINDETFFNFSCYESGNRPAAVVGTFPDRSYASGEEIEIYLSAAVFIDDGEAINYSVSGLPSGLTFDGVNKISGIAPGLGTYVVSVTATDRYLNKATDSFTLMVQNQASVDMWEPGTYFSAGNYEAKCAAPRPGINASTGLFFPDVAGSTIDENNWLRSWSEDLYYWYRELPDLNPALYSTPDYFARLKTTEKIAGSRDKDRFHFSVDTAEWQAQSRAGESVGYGLNIVLTRAFPPREAVVAYVDPGSPAAFADIGRGDKIISVDGEKSSHG